MSSILIKTVTESAEKKRIMFACDDAFTVSVTNRSNFEELFDKIDRNAAFLGAYTKNGEIAGYSAFYDNDAVNRTAYITLFCVRTQMQRMHVGTALMDASIEEAASGGMDRIKLEVLKVDKGAIEFYKHNKFVITGCATDDSYYMERSVRES